MASNEDKESGVEQNGPSGNHQELQERAFPKSGGSAEVEPTATEEAGQESAPRTTTGRQRRDPNREERAAERQGQLVES